MIADLHPRQAERLSTLRRYGILDTERETVFDEIVELASRICETPISVVNLIDAERQWFKAEVGLGVRETPLETSICSHVILAEEFVEIPDTLLDPRMADNPLCMSDPNLRFYAGAQLVAPNGLPIGTLCVLDNKPRILTDLQKETLRILARQIMRELEFKRVLEQQDVLRREMDHRVKNSLQTVASFISLYRRNADLSRPEEAFEAIERRVRAISTLHEELHHADDEQEIQLERFLNRVVEQLKETLPVGVSLTADVEKVSCGSSIATCMGIVLSEFVANSVKHAFPNGRKGEIRIALRLEGEKVIVLECKDDGVGSQVTSSPDGRIQRLGTRLKEAAVAQVNGSLTRHVDASGYAIRLAIPHRDGQS